MHASTSGVWIACSKICPLLSRLARRRAFGSCLNSEPALAPSSTNNSSTRARSPFSSSGLIKSPRTRYPSQSSCRFPASLNIARFQFEQEPLPLEAAAETHEVARRPDDAVAGHDDGDGVAPIRRSDRSDGARGANLSGDLAVTACFPVWDGAQDAPHTLLEIGTHNFQWHVEYTKISGKISPKLAERFVHHR